MKNDSEKCKISPKRNIKILFMPTYSIYVYGYNQNILFVETGGLETSSLT